MPIPSMDTMGYNARMHRIHIIEEPECPLTSFIGWKPLPSRLRDSGIPAWQGWGYASLTAFVVHHYLGHYLSGVISIQTIVVIGVL